MLRLLIVVLTLLLCHSAYPQVELRGVWSHATAMDSPEKALRLADLLAEARVNAVYPLFFYWGGTAFWDSRIVPRADVVQQGFDPLAYFIPLARQRGIEVHVRFVVGNYGTSSPGRLFPSHPDWRLVDKDGKAGDWYDLANPEFRDFILRAIVEVALRYPVDGVQLDFIRYPSLDWGYTQAAKAGFRQEYGMHIDLAGAQPTPTAQEATRIRQAWTQYREDRVTSLMRSIYAHVKRTRPECVVSAAVFRSVESSMARLQNWPAWLKEGIVDYVMPMAYTTDNDSLRANVREWRSLDPSFERIIPGLAIYNTRNESGPPPAPSAVLAQYTVCKDGGARGVCFFSANQLTPELAAALRERAFTTPATAYRPPERLR